MLYERVFSPWIWGRNLKSLNPSQNFIRGRHHQFLCKSLTLIWKCHLPYKIKPLHYLYIISSREQADLHPKPIYSGPVSHLELDQMSFLGMKVTFIPKKDVWSKSSWPLGPKKTSDLNLVDPLSPKDDWSKSSGPSVPKMTSDLNLVDFGPKKTSDLRSKDVWSKSS